MTSCGDCFVGIWGIDPDVLLEAESYHEGFVALVATWTKNRTLLHAYRRESREDHARRFGQQQRDVRVGERISSPVSLVDGDEIRLGPVTLTFRLLSPESSTVSMA